MNEKIRAFCFKHPKGEDIYLVTLRNKDGSEVKITNYGAIITSYKVKDRSGKMNDIVLGFDNVEDYLAPAYVENYPYFGAAIGRYANRIGNDSFTIEGKTYKLNPTAGKVHLHGGTEGFDKKVWKILEITSTTLTLFYSSPDGDEGYPGTLETTLHFELNEKGELTLTYTAKTDKPTPVNLTHHSYFNLNNGKGRIDKHYVTIPASKVEEQHPDLVATGNLIDVTNTPFDFRRPKKIDTDWDPLTGYDQSWVLDDPDPSRFAAEAYSEDSGLRLRVFTTEPVLHFYTGRWNPGVKGKNGNIYDPFTGFCFETQIHSNAINVPDFPDTILYPGDTYKHRTTYSVNYDR